MEFFRRRISSSKKRNKQRRATTRTSSSTANTSTKKHSFFSSAKSSAFQPVELKPQTNVTGRAGLAASSLRLDGSCDDQKESHDGIFDAGRYTPPPPPPTDNKMGTNIPLRPGTFDLSTISQSSFVTEHTMSRTSLDGKSSVAEEAKVTFNEDRHRNDNYDKHSHSSIQTNDTDELRMTNPWLEPKRNVIEPWLRRTISASLTSSSMTTTTTTSLSQSPKKQEQQGACPSDQSSDQAQKMESKAAESTSEGTSYPTAFCVAAEMLSVDLCGIIPPEERTMATCGRYTTNKRSQLKPADPPFGVTQQSSTSPQDVPREIRYQDHAKDLTGQRTFVQEVELVYPHPDRVKERSPSLISKVLRGARLTGRGRSSSIVSSEHHGQKRKIRTSNATDTTTTISNDSSTADESQGSDVVPVVSSPVHNVKIYMETPPPPKRVKRTPSVQSMVTLPPELMNAMKEFSFDDVVDLGRAICSPTR